VTELLERAQLEAQEVPLPDGWEVVLTENEHPEQGCMCLWIDVRHPIGSMVHGQMHIIPWELVTDGTVTDHVKLMILDQQLAES
jgi:hypothetical protein